MATIRSESAELFEFERCRSNLLELNFVLDFLEREEDEDFEDFLDFTDFSNCDDCFVMVSKTFCKRSGASKSAIQSCERKSFLIS